jgi:hypothetical protein
VQELDPIVKMKQDVDVVRQEAHNVEQIAKVQEEKLHEEEAELRTRALVSSVQLPLVVSNTRTSHRLIPHSCSTTSNTRLRLIR